jgi:hypothetical protein
MNAQYNPHTSYLSQALFFDVVHEPTSHLNQDLAVAGLPGDPHPNFSTAPEPSSLFIAGLGALGLIGYGCHMRNARRRPR